jgi:uncharacterized protein YfaS (alpha-2-macroglobulin family)
MRSLTRPRLYRPAIFAFLVASTGLSGRLHAQPEPQQALAITRVTPTGTDVPVGRQIVLQFNRPVVPIGRMDRSASELPIEMTPALECQWRWLDPSALACQLDQEHAFAPATRYEITVAPGIEAEDGATIADTFRTNFVTERPGVVRATFSTWRGPAVPVIRVIFNQPVGEDSVREHVFFLDDRLGRQPSAVEPDENDRELPRLLPLPGEELIADFGRSQTAQSDDRQTEIAGVEARRIWLVSPVAELAGDARVELRVEPGLRSAEGPLTGDERRVVVEFDTFPDYRALGIVCTTNENREVLIPDGSAADGSQARACNPLRQVGIAFSAPTLNAEVREQVSIAPDLAGGRTDYDPWDQAYEYSRLQSSHRRGARYVVWLPEFLQAAEPYRIRAIDGGVGPRDEFGRELTVPLDIEFRTDHRLPNFEIVHQTAVIESDVDSAVPLFVTNLDDATLTYRRLTAAGAESGLTSTRELADVEDVQYAVPFGIRDMLDGRSGAVFGRVTTNPSVTKVPQQRMLFAQVTPYQVHVKLGHFNSLVWVTDLASGAPVDNALVSIYVGRLVDLSQTFSALATARTYSDGTALLEGTAELDPDLDLLKYYCTENDQDACPRLFVRIDHSDEIALVPLDRRFAVSPYRLSNYTVFNRNQPRFGHLRSWGVTPQGVYRAGDTIDFKIYVRDQSNERLIEPPPGTYTLEVIDPMGNTVHKIESIELSRFGGFSGSYDVPESAVVGWYQFKLTADFAELERFPMRVLVSDFTPSSFRVSTKLNGDRFEAGSEVEASLQAALFSGGPYIDADARVTANVTSLPFRSEHPVADGFAFGRPQAPRTLDVSQITATVDAAGEMRHRFELPETLGEQLVYGRLNVEGAVRHDRGSYVANATSASFLAVNRLVGLKNTRWTYQEDETAIIESVVVDGGGTPVAGTPVTIEIERLDTKAARVKGAGNAFLTEFVSEWVGVAHCESISASAVSECRFVPDAPGRYRAIATIEDTQGRPHATEVGAWVRGKGQVVWNTGNDDRLEIVPEKTSYRIGDTARYMIQNPYPGALALVTVERYGVLKQWTETLDSSTPVIEFDVEPDFMPGYYLSVLVTSPRVDAPLPDFGEVDLGKPAFKMGYLAVPVADPYKQLDIDVSIERPVYKPRETVRVAIDARPAHGRRDEPIEVAVIALDEAVLDLIQGGTTYFDPYQGFNELDSLDVRNFGLLTRLVGRQRIELKGANDGGDGGASLSMRSLIKYVGFWEPSLVLDEHGHGDVEFTLPDNLTGWRMLVVGTTPTDRMGLGDAAFTVNLPTEIRPVMPNQVTEGDSFLSGFSISNRTDTARDIRVRIAVDGDVETREPHEERIRLDPYQRRTVFMPVEAGLLAISRDRTNGRIRFDVRARDDADGDGLIHELTVNRQRTLQTGASAGSMEGSLVTESFRVPEQIYTDVGELGVDLSPSVIGNLEGAFRYLRDYPYTAWEQRLSKAVLASQFRSLSAYLDDELVWAESDVLPEETLAQAANFQAPNGGMTYFIAQDRFVSPYLSAYTALAFNWLGRAGYTIPTAVESKLHEYLDGLLRRDVVPDFYSPGMASTVRAVALAALAEHGRVGLADLARYREHLEYMSLFGKAHYLMAATAVAGGEAIANEALEAILRHSVRSAGKLSFNETLDDGYLRLLATPLRANCAVLAALVRGGGEDPEGSFALVRTITQTRGNRDHWENTQENVFCMNALVDYARRYESVEPDVTVSAVLDGERIGTARFADRRDPLVGLTRAITPDDPGQARTLQITPQGQGRVYYSARISYASSDEPDQRTNAGIDVRREYSVQRDGEWVLLDEPALIGRGDLVRVDIFVSLPTARHFVVLDDPVPGGLEPVNRDLANASIVDANAGSFEAAAGSWWFQFGDWHYYNVSRWSFHHQELTHSAVRFYSDYLPPGNYHLSYTAQAIAEGTFKRLPARAEEMYDPDIYGTGLPGTLAVGPAPAAGVGQ